MHRIRLTLILVATALLASCRFETPEDRLVRLHLERKYPMIEDTSGPEIDICFSRRKSNLTRVDDPGAAVRFEGISFYTATLFTTFVHLHKPEVLIACRHTDSGPVIREIFPMYFRDPDPQFFEMLSGVPVASREHAMGMARLLAEFLAQVNELCDVKPHDEEDGRARAMLRRQGRSYRFVEIQYSLDEGVVTKVQVYRTGPHPTEVHENDMRCPTCED